MTKSSFPGFPLDLLHFLDEMAKNNNRQWFTSNKARYEHSVREPALAFIEAMAKPLQSISPHFCAIAKKTGGSLMRIHRDVRFSKDKRPYKTNIGIQFRHETGCDVHSPGFYFHIEPESVFLGAGTWHPEPKALAKIRRAIDEHPDAWKKAKGGKAFRDRWQLSGDSLKTRPKGFSADHPLIEDLRRKDHIAICQLDHNALLSPAIVRAATAAYKSSKPYVALLCEAMGVDF